MYLGSNEVEIHLRSWSDLDEYDGRLFFCLHAGFLVGGLGLIVDGFGLIVDGLSLIIDGFGLIIDGLSLIVEWFGLIVHGLDFFDE